MPPPAAAAPPARPFRSFGWSLAGIVGVSLSLPPVGFYPLAWVGFVPFLVRWSLHRSAAECARETYALMLTLTACSGFWLLFHQDAVLGVLGGLGILTAPLPFVAAATLSGVVRRRFGLVPGLAALVLTVVTLEYALVSLPVGMPWLLAGHTQVEALPFVQMADTVGVLGLSLWVLMLNTVAFAALPMLPPAGTPLASWVPRAGDSGIAVALFAVLLALPAAYGAARSGASEDPAGYARVGIVQPGVRPAAWERSGAARVDLMAELSDRLLKRWHAADSSRAADNPIFGRVSARRGRDASVGLLVWPQGTLPWMGSNEREAATVARIEQWCALRNVALVTGLTTKAPHNATATSAMLITPGGQTVRYDQMRRMPVADAPAVLGTQRTLMPVGGVRVATLLGFESLYGDHARRFADQGADLFVVLAQSDRWGQSPGLEQHLHATRLRAIETRRPVVVTSAGGISAVITPFGQIEQAADWMQQGLVPLDVPMVRMDTYYTRHGDWVGRWALAGALLLYGALGTMLWLLPRLNIALRGRPPSGSNAVVGRRPRTCAGSWAVSF